MSRQSILPGPDPGLSTNAVVFEQPQRLCLRHLPLPAPGPGQLLVDVEWSGISTGTEKLLWTGQMPDFPGMGYPLVPGYETVGRVIGVGAGAVEGGGVGTGERVFVAGARCYGDVRGLFGGAASCLVADADKVVPVSDELAADAVLLALAATAHHALVPDERPALPDLIVGHGVLGRLLARLTLALGGAAPTVWEQDASRRRGAQGYRVVDPADDGGGAYARIVDASGDAGILDSLIARLARNGEIVLAGFYRQPLSFTFPPAFLREARLRIAAEWAPEDLRSVSRLVERSALSLAGLITHALPAAEAHTAYPLAFSDPECLKMVLDWRSH